MTPPQRVIYIYGQYEGILPSLGNEYPLWIRSMREETSAILELAEASGDKSLMSRADYLRDLRQRYAKEADPNDHLYNVSDLTMDVSLVQLARDLRHYNYNKQSRLEMLLNT